MEIIDYKSAAIKSLNNRDLIELKNLHSLKDLQIFLIDDIKDLLSIIPNDEIGFIYTKNVRTYLESLYILSALNGVDFKYNHLYKSDLSIEEIKNISENLETKY